MSGHKGIRLDRFFGLLTLICLLVLAVMIYFDYFAEDKTSDNQVTESETTQEVSEAVQEETTFDSKEKSTSGVIVCLDASHGGKDSGISYNSKTEKEISLNMALAVKKELENVGIKVVLTRDSDVDIADSTRTKLCNDSNAKLIVSLGMNTYSGDSSISGVEAFIHTSKPKDSTELATDILNRLNKDAGYKNRGVKTGKETALDDNFYINAHCKCTSAVVNLGFMTNASDLANVTTKKDTTAKAIAGGITDYLKQAGLY